jgi:tRNA(Ile)-lysidine synthase
MQDKISLFIQKNRLFDKGKKLLLAVSGGIDSMVLMHWLHENKMNFAVAHCNFKLRADESDADADFVKNYCKKLSVECHYIEFDTQNFASDNKLSIQEAARKLRYEWLEATRKNLDLDFILTAHHLDDNMETLLLNLIKGTGIKGLRGMLPKNGKIVRPMLEISKNEILKYAETHMISFREDSSNKLMKYDRNKIRNQIIPQLQEINPGLHESMMSHFRNYLSIEKLYNSGIADYRKKLFIEKNGYILIPVKKLMTIDGYEALAFELLSGFGFNNTEIETLLNSVNQPESKMIVNNTYRIVKDKQFFVVSKINDESAGIYYIDKSTDKVRLADGSMLKIHFKPISKHSKIIPSAEYLYADADKLQFPLTIRQWQQGDYFYPISNEKTGKKKVSKFFKDEKTPLYIKENCPVLVSGQSLVWVIGQRADNRFKITSSTRNIVKITLVKPKS